MREWIFIGVMVFIVFSGQSVVGQSRHLPVSEASEQAAGYFAAAQDALDNQQLSRYFKELSAATEADSSFFMASALLTVYAHLLDSTNLIEVHGREALRRDSGAILESERIMRTLVDLLLDRADPSEMGAAAAQLSEVYPECIEAHLLNGQLQFKAGRVTEALKAFFRVRELDQAYGPGYKYLAKTYLSVESFDKAGAYFEMYIVTTPEMADPHECIGDFYSVIGWKEHALRHYQWALNIDPELTGISEKMAVLDSEK